MIIRQLIHDAVGLLTRAAIESSVSEASLLLAYCLSKPVSWVYAHPEESCDDETVVRFMALVDRRCHGEPMAYITGECEFMSLRFYVNRHVLIPRADTELLVEAGLYALGLENPYFCQKMFRLKLSRPARMLDIGTGSGCLPVSMVKRMPGLSADAVDVSPDALIMARRNAERYGVADAIRFLSADFLQGLSFDHEPYDLILSNPPYIAYHEREDLMPSVKDYEPALALFAEDRGLAFYTKMASEACRLMAPGGILLVECGYTQAADVSEIFRNAGMAVLSLKDLAGIDRAVAAYFPS